MRRRVVLSALVFAFAAGCGGADRPAEETVTRTSSAIQGGTLDTTHNFAVGVIQHAGQAIAFCSGVLLAPNLVATARHCVSNLSSTQIDCATSVFASTLPATEILVTPSPTIDKASAFIGVSSITVPPASPVCGNDIALLILSSNIQVPLYVTPTISPPMTDHQAYGTAVTAIGYGVDTPVDTKGASAGVRRIRQDIGLVCIPNDKGFTDCFSDPRASQYISPHEFEGGDGTCEGDSGSGAFEQGSFTTGKWVAFGVLSRGGSSADAGTCLGSIYTRFDSWGKLIVDAAARAATLGHYNPPSWTGLPPLDDGGGSSAADSSAAPASPDGAPAPEAGSAPACLASGTTCGSDLACCSKSCISYDTAQTPFSCACDGTHPCKAGYSCQRALCVPALPANAGGCSVGAAGSDGAPPWYAAAGAVLAGALLGRRKRRLLEFGQSTALGRPMGLSKHRKDKAAVARAL